MDVGTAITLSLQADKEADLGRNWTHDMSRRDSLGNTLYHLGFLAKWRCTRCGLLSLHPDLGTQTTTCPPPTYKNGNPVYLYG